MRARSASRSAAGRLGVGADQNDLSALVSAINGVAGTTGITATFTSSTAKNSITLSTTDGRNIGLGDFANGGARSHRRFGGTTLTEAVTVSAIKCACRSGRRPRRPTRLNSNVGTNCSAGTNPTVNPLLSDRSSTSQPSAIVCIHVPMSDVPWPKKNSL